MTRRALAEESITKNTKPTKLRRELDSYSIHMGFRLRFTSPLIMHAFDQKAVEQMLHKQMKHPVEQLPKVPADCIERATMRNEKGEIALLCAQIKAAVLAGASGLEATKGLQLRSKFWVVGNSIPIAYDSQTNRIDMVMVGVWPSRVADVRFRPQFNNVRCSIVVEVPETIVPEMVYALLNRAGKIGVGDWRPQKGGQFGKFVVEEAIMSQDELRTVMTACAPMVPPLVIPEWAMNAEISPVLLARIMDESRRSDAPEENE